MEEFERIDQTFYFNCARCGNCCTGDQKVFLNLYDLYKLARFKNYKHSKLLFDAALVVLVKEQNNAFLPRIRFKRKPYSFCPFLLHLQTNPETFITGCMLHPFHKPLICALAPLGRVIDLDENSDDYIFVKPAPDCSGVHSKQANSLDKVKTQYRQELDFQYRFFTLLQKAKNKHFGRKNHLEQLYYFALDRPFAAILAEKEKNFM